MRNKEFALIPNKLSLLVRAIEDKYYEAFGHSMDPNLIQVFEMLDADLQYQILCTNNVDLVKQVLTAGYSMHSTDNKHYLERREVLPLYGDVKSGYAKKDKVIYSTNLELGNLVIAVVYKQYKGLIRNGKSNELKYNDSYQLVIYEPQYKEVVN